MGSLVFLSVSVSVIWLVACLIQVPETNDAMRRRWARWALLTPLALPMVPLLCLYHAGRGAYSLWRIADVSLPKMKPPVKMKRKTPKVKEIRKHFCIKCGAPMKEGPYK